MGTEHFTGEAHARDLIAPTSAPAIFAAVVRFEAGARNHWHAHPGGQLLHVIEGEGWVQVRGQAPQRIRKGDTVTSDPGEEHWHGAGSDGPMTHIAVAIGETRWLEESPPPPA
jgi:quercetin dioxygenase-like cupin family protein